MSDDAEEELTAESETAEEITEEPPVEEEASADESSESDGDSTQPESNDAPQSGSAPSAFDAASLPPIESSYEDDSLNDYFRAALTPITDEFPCGQNEDAASSVISQIETQGDAIHESLRSAFGDAVRDDNMSSFDMASSGRDASDLVDQIVECLEEKCKSIVLATYLPHLMLISHGLEGFQAGLDICRELVSRFPDHIFPQEKERVVNYLRRGVYVGNDDKVTENYKLFLYLPITERSCLPYALLRNSRIKGTNADAEGKYANDAAGSSPEFFVKIINDIQSVVDSAKTVNTIMAQFLDEDLMEIVSYSFIDSVERMGSIVESLATDNCAGYPPVEAVETEQVAGGGSGVTPGAAVAGEIVNREQALELLSRVADFFHRTERHSPASYRIRETVRWCKMDLPELLEELLSGDSGPLEELGKRVGFKKKEDEYEG